MLSFWTRPLLALVCMAYEADDVPWMFSADWEKPYLFPPGWDREPSCHAYNHRYCPWLLKDSSTTATRSATVAATSGAVHVPSKNGAVSDATTSAQPSVASDIAAAPIGLESTLKSLGPTSSAVTAVSTGVYQASQVAAGTVARNCDARLLVLKPETNKWNHIPRSSWFSMAEVTSGVEAPVGAVPAIQQVCPSSGQGLVSSTIIAAYTGGN